MTIPIKNGDELPFPTGDIDDQTTRTALGGPQVAPLAGQTRESLTGDSGAQAQPGDGEARRPGAVEETLGDQFGRGVSAIADEGSDLWNATILAVRGGQKFRGADGNLYAEFPDGHIEPVKEGHNTLPGLTAPSPGFFSEEARRGRQLENEERMRRSPGLFQPGGFFDRDGRPTNE